MGGKVRGYGLNDRIAT